jgi:hypothetical protein
VSVGLGVGVGVGVTAYPLSGLRIRMPTYKYAIRLLVGDVTVVRERRYLDCVALPCDADAQLYFGAATITTVGYGDVKPITEAGRWFTSLYVVVRAYIWERMGASGVTVWVPSQVGVFFVGTAASFVASFLLTIHERHLAQVGAWVGKVGMNR